MADMDGLRGDDPDGALIDVRRPPVASVLESLLADKSVPAERRGRDRHIVWATDSYASQGEGFAETDPICAGSLLRHADVIRPRFMKSRDAQSVRTRKKAEVTTSTRLCRMMNDVCDEDWFGRPDVFSVRRGDGAWESAEGTIVFPKGRTWRQYVDSRRLEITCGEAPYLASRYDAATGERIPPDLRIGVLDRKLRVVDENAAGREEWTKWAIRALEATYGYEFQGDSLLIARVNLLMTFVERHEARWGAPPNAPLLRKAANRIAWNVWQMDGLADLPPFARSEADAPVQLDFLAQMQEPDGPGDVAALDKMADDAAVGGAGLPALPDGDASQNCDTPIGMAGRSAPPRQSPPCRIYDWRARRPIVFRTLKEERIMGSKLFDYVVGNPPYQKESEGSVSETNGQKPMTNIFQYFQVEANKITGKSSVLVYPGGRWIHRSGKGMQTFGRELINDKRLSVLEFHPDASELFGDAASIPDGITIVTMNHGKTEGGFTYVYSRGGERISVHADNPGDRLMPLDPRDLPIEQKIDSVIREKGWKYLHEAILPRSLFPIDSDFVSKNPDKVRPCDTGGYRLDSKAEIKLLTNDKAGKSGRATWFIAKRDVITRNQKYIDEWQVVVSSANAGGQKRDNQLEIIDNHSAFGRSRLALRSFKTKAEAVNFHKYVKSYFIRYAFLLTDESLTSLGKEVPDIADYSDANGIVDFKGDVDEQLCALFSISADEFSYMKNRVTSLRGDSNDVKEMA